MAIRLSYYIRNECSCFAASSVNHSNSIEKSEYLYSTPPGPWIRCYITLQIFGPSGACSVLQVNFLKYTITEGP